MDAFASEQKCHLSSPTFLPSLGIRAILPGARDAPLRNARAGKGAAPPLSPVIAQFASPRPARNAPRAASTFSFSVSGRYTSPVRIAIGSPSNVSFTT